MPHHGYIPTLAGKKTFAHEMALHDITDFNLGKVQKNLQTEINQAVKNQDFNLIITDSLWRVNLHERPYNLYYLKKNGEGGYPVTGYYTKPRFVYEAK